MGLYKRNPAFSPALAQPRWFASHLLEVAARHGLIELPFELAVHDAAAPSLPLGRACNGAGLLLIAVEATLVRRYADGLCEA